MRAMLLSLLLLAPAVARADYDSGGRRDPFVPPDAASGELPAWDQVRLTAVLVSPAGSRALVVGGPAGLGVTVRPGDHLGEGTVRTIDARRGVVLVEVPEPASPRGSRDVPLTLR